jgi:hypothetical protein
MIRAAANTGTPAGSRIVRVQVTEIMEQRAGD